MPSMTPSEIARPARRWLWILLALSLLVGVILVVLSLEDTIDVQQSEAPPLAPQVSIVTIFPKPSQASVSSFAEIRPRWDAELRSTVTGRITKVHQGALAGVEVQQGDVLFSIEKARYKSTVAAAEMQLEEAKLTLLRAKNKATVAHKQFARDGIAPPTELAVGLPQVRIAEKNVAAAESRLAVARHDLADTEVTAPFTGFVMQRSANLGQTVNPGDQLLRLADNDQFELVAEFSQSDWKLLDQPITDTMASLYHRDGTPLRQARIRSGGGFLDKDTRQMRVFLEVTNPDGQFLAGDLVQVTIPGRLISNTLTFPESALTRSGYVWFLDQNNLLQRFIPEILFRSGDKITILAPDGAAPWRIAKTPLASFLPGNRVSPTTAQD